MEDTKVTNHITSKKILQLAQTCLRVITRGKWYNISLLTYPPLYD